MFLITSVFWKFGTEFRDERYSTVVVGIFLCSYVILGFEFWFSLCDFVCKIRMGRGCFFNCYYVFFTS